MGIAWGLTVLLLLQLIVLVFVCEVGTHTRKEDIARACGLLAVGLAGSLLLWWGAVMTIITWRTFT